MHRIVNDEALDILFRAPRQPRAWLASPVSDTMLRALWELVKLGPTDRPSGPGRIVFVRSPEAKSRLAAAVAAAEREAILAASTTAIVADHAGRQQAALHAAYLILAARALGLDCCPIWQFDGAAVDSAFFAGAGLAAAFLCVLGYSDETAPRSPAPHRAFDEACAIL